MKTICMLIFLAIGHLAFSQSDHNGNPVFNSIVVKEEHIDDFVLTSSYYTLNNNITNKTSSVFISESPSLNNIEKAARRLPSDFFIISKNNQVVNLVMLQKKSGYSFFVINPATKVIKNFDAQLEGDITENRATEIVGSRYDENAKIVDGYLYFANKKLQILSTDTVRAKVIMLIKQQQLNNGVPDKTVFLTQAELRNEILTASKEGGKLDFWTPIKGHEYEAVLMDGLIATKLEISVIAWIANVVRAGITSKSDIISIYEEVKNRPVSGKDKSMIDYGYKKALEQ